MSHITVISLLTFFRNFCNFVVLLSRLRELSQYSQLKGLPLNSTLSQLLPLPFPQTISVRFIVMSACRYFVSLPWECFHWASRPDSLVQSLPRHTHYRSWPSRLEKPNTCTLLSFSLGVSYVLLLQVLYSQTLVFRICKFNCLSRSPSNTIVFTVVCQYSVNSFGPKAVITLCIKM